MMRKNTKKRKEKNWCQFIFPSFRGKKGKNELTPIFLHWTKYVKSVGKARSGKCSRIMQDGVQKAEIVRLIPLSSFLEDIMALYTELEQPMTLLELVRIFETNDPPAGIDEGSFMWYEEVAVKIVREYGKEGLDYLLSFLPKWDEKRLCGVLLSLSFLQTDFLTQNRAMLVDLLLSFLHDSRPLIVAEAIRTLRHIDCQVALVHVLPFVHHPSPFVRGAVLHFLSKCDFSIAKPYLFEALESTSPILRQVAIDELDEAQCVDAIPKIRELLSDENPDVHQAAQTAIENLEEK